MGQVASFPDTESSAGPIPQIHNGTARANTADLRLIPRTRGHGLALLEVPRVRAHFSGESGPAIKRVVDVVLGSIATVLTLPVMCVVAAVIKLDSQGPALYLATRVGRKGVPFICYKFRTMCAHADRAKLELRARNERQGAFFKIAADPRITRVGRWLRRYSLDELPQLWNVLRGEMSLVGPRPHPVDDVECYDLEDLQRLDFTPGMTGLWQVTARSDPSFKRCVALDTEYIRNWSLLLDFKILVRTVSAVLCGSGT